VAGVCVISVGMAGASPAGIGGIRTAAAVSGCAAIPASTDSAFLASSSSGTSSSNSVSPSPSPSPEVPQLCILVQPSGGSRVLPGQTAAFSIIVWTTQATSDDTTVTIMVRPAMDISSPSFATCPYSQYQDPSAPTCSLGNLPVGQAESLVATVAVGSQAAPGEHVELIGDASATGAASVGSWASVLVAAPTPTPTSSPTPTGTPSPTSSPAPTGTPPPTSSAAPTDTRSASGRARVARQIAALGGRRLVVVVLANGTPAQAAALAARLPAGQDLLWVAPPGTTAKQAAAYRAIVAARPGFRVESLPAALTAVNALTGRARATSAGSWSPTGALATATLVAVYASTAYRLESVSAQARTVLSWAEEQLGKPYQWGAAGPGSFDCSGLTMVALAQAGITVTHNANAQWQQTKAYPVAENQLAPGDLVFYAGSDGSPAAPGHVGIYVGNGEIIDAPYPGADVRFDPLTGISGYLGATDPYVPAPVAGINALSPGSGNLAALAVLNQYQSFAQTLADATWGSSQFLYLNLLWDRESGWNPAATNPVSGAFGIPQALPAVKMASAGLDWATDPYTQIIWGIGYIQAAYGTPQAAWAHEFAYGWY
jgi:cell wall-associated NlpC family hydrolase